MGRYEVVPLISLDFEEMGRCKTHTFVFLEAQGDKEKTTRLATEWTGEWDIS